MEPRVTGSKYDKIAHWWHSRHVNSNYGVEQFKQALKFTTQGGDALDVGCGAGGRFISLLQDKQYQVTGIDTSKEMIALAQKNHPQYHFIHDDICTWQTNKKFDFIYAWDSIFHLPLHQQKPVINKLCSMLKTNGVFMYTFGNAIGEHSDTWHNDTFYYSSIGINENLNLLMTNGLTIQHLELDQYPQKHVYVIATKA